MAKLITETRTDRIIFVVENNSNFDSTKNKNQEYETSNQKRVNQFMESKMFFIEIKRLSLTRYNYKKD